MTPTMEAMMTAEARAVNVFNDSYNAGLRPDPDLTVSEWADANRWLSTVESPEPGQWRTARTPYLREIQDCLSACSPVEEVTFVKGTQLGATTGPAGNFVGYTISQRPGVMMIVLPTIDVARRWSKQKLAHMLESTGALKGIVQERRSRDGSNTILEKEYPGGMICITGANSAVGLRSTSAPYLIFDEVDGFPMDVDGEGDPVKLAEKRADNFPNRKKLKISTPTESPSRIMSEFRRGDQRYYFVPCPICGDFQALWFKNFEYGPKDAPAKAWFNCVSCGEAIEERHKTRMLNAAKWVPTYGEDSIRLRSLTPSEFEELAQAPKGPIASYHLPSFYSPTGWFSWLSVAKEWVDAHRDSRKLKTFINTVLGEEWVERGDAPDWKLLYERRRDVNPGFVPAGVLFLTAGADIQKDRIEVEIVGWGKQWRSWSVDYRRIEGDTRTDRPWIELDNLLMETFPGENGKEFPIWAMGVDSGDNAPMVYKFARRHPQPFYGPAGTKIANTGTVVVTKGGDSPVRIIENVSNDDAARKRGNLRIYTLGTHYLKQEFMDWAKGQPFEINGQLEYPVGYCFFPNYEPWVFQGYCSESRVVRENGDVEWVRDPAVRNEPLDVRVMARGAAHLCVSRYKAAHWDALESAIGVEPVQIDDSQLETEELIHETTSPTNETTPTHAEATAPAKPKALPIARRVVRRQISRSKFLGG